MTKQGSVIWLTGLSASGKSTLAFALERHFTEQGRAAYVLDGDIVRRGLSRDLGFSQADRSENIRRVGEVAALLADAGICALVALISPYRSDRAQARAMVPSGYFFEVHISTPLDICERRDPKGIYRKARLGLLPGFTGIDAPYESPEKAEVVLNTSGLSVSDCVDKILRSCMITNWSRYSSARVKESLEAARRRDDEIARASRLKDSQLRTPFGGNES